MTDRAAHLLAEVLAEPANEAARQVLADALLVAGDPRGELVQLDLALAGPLSIRRRPALQARRAELIKRHAATWWPYPIEYRVHLGFIEEVAGTLAQLAAAGPALFAAEPVVTVTVTEIGGAAGALQLAAAPWMDRVRRLVVRGIDDEGIAAVVAAPACQGLASLNASTNDLSSEATAGLAGHLPACRTLALSHNEIGDDGIDGVRAWQHVARVETLYLSECQLSTRGVAALLSEPLPALVKLALTGNDLDDGVATVFAERAAHLPALRVLELRRAGLSPDALDAFRRGELALERLDLRCNPIGPRDAAGLPFVRVDA